MLKSTLFGILHRIARFVPLSKLIRWTGQSLFLPFYHALGSDLPHIRHLYPPRSAKQFEQDLDYLLQFYSPIDLNRLWQAINGQKPLTQPSFFLSFDDGLRQVYEIARPILLRKGIPATFFLNPDFIDNQALMFRYKASLLVEEWLSDRLPSSMKTKAREILLQQDRFKGDVRNSLLQAKFSDTHILDEIAQVWDIDWTEFLNQYQPYLSTSQVLQMQNEGFSFGAHSLDHRLYFEWPLEEQLKQTLDSMTWVRQQLKPSIDTFAFPFTDDGVSTQFFDHILGQEGNIHLSFGGAGLKQDISTRHLQRFPMEKTSFPAQSIIPAEYVYYLLKVPFGKNRLTRK